MTTQGERIAAMEVRLKILEQKVDSMDAKLDELLALKYKGQGVFWLASAIFGTSIVGTIVLLTSWLRN
jgi:hypothetical protein